MILLVPQDDPLTKRGGCHRRERLAGLTRGGCRESMRPQGLGPLPGLCRSGSVMPGADHHEIQDTSELSAGDARAGSSGQLALRG